ncbi:MAG TPA: hypothetical protein VJQ44_07880 [Gemmatimonadales bacterium]|nr:hypothetical protein [Gemmatimonadales bacterium]
MHRRTALGLLLIAGGVAPSLSAQEHAHGHGERLGRVVFPVSCRAEAQHRFERAMAALHSFWWEEGPRAFGAVLEADSTCAMAHWGLALNAWGNPFAGGPSKDLVRTGAGEAAQAAALGAPTARERGFIAAASALYRDYETVPAPVRLQAYSDTLARLYRDEPREPEVALYYALSLIATAPKTDTTYVKQKRAAAILDPLFARYPDHPGLAHYIIHADDSPALAHLGLNAARRYAAIAPDAPHAQHMPSHIFVRLGLWDETVASNRRSYEAGARFARAQGIAGAVYENYHAMDYMVYGYLQEGRDSAARAVVAQGLAVSEVRGPSPLVRGYNRTAMEARVPLERGDWLAASALPVRMPDIPVCQMLIHFARGIGAARSSRAGQLQDEVAELAKVEKLLDTPSDAYWSRVAGIKRQALGAWTLLAAGDTAGALAAAKAAADSEAVTEKHPITPGELIPARELEADLNFQVARYREARTAYLATLKREPGRARSVFGAARAAEMAGDKAAAAKGYRQYLELMRHADGDRPELRIARAGAKAG